MKAVIGVDMGGTLTRVCTHSDGKITHRTEFNTAEGDTSPPALMSRILEEIRLHSAWGIDGVAGVGLVFPGPLNPFTGVVYQLPNVPGWDQEVDVTTYFEGNLEFEVYVGNDANAATMAEHRFGAGQQVDDMVYLTVSTGLGGGAYGEGILLVGNDGCATEFGHMKIAWRNGAKCGCGGFGCLEAYASGTGITRMARECIIGGDGPPSDWDVYLQEHGLKRRDITAEIVANAARAGVQSARFVIDRAAQALGIGLANIANTHNPQRIVLGGGVMKSADLILPIAKRVMQANALSKNREVEIVLGTLGEDRGLLGAVAMVLGE